MNVLFFVSGLAFVATSALGMKDFYQTWSGEITLEKGKFVTYPETKKYRPEFSDKFLKAVKENDIKTAKKFLKVEDDEILDIVSRSNNPKALEKNLGQRIYIKTRTNINTQDKDGNTPLMWAVRNGNQEMINLLLGCKDVDISLKNKDKNDALDIAIMKGYVDILQKPEVEEFNNLWNADISVIKILLKKKMVLLSYPGYSVHSKDYLRVLSCYSGMVSEIKKDKNYDLEKIKCIFDNNKDSDIQHL